MVCLNIIFFNIFICFDRILLLNRDNVEWDSEQEEQARLKVSSNSGTILDEEKIVDFEENANKFWDKFYDIHTNR